MKGVLDQKRGFTLVELAIVLVIIGLILGAVLKGQEMIFNAKVKNLVNGFNGLMAAVYSYQDRYGYLPGDDPKASTRWTGATDGNGDGVWNTAERTNAWSHLRYSRLIAGDGTDTTPVNHAFGGQYQFYYYNFGGTVGRRNCIMAINVPADAARMLDEKYDDGVYNTGSIRASADYTSTALLRIYWALD